MWIIPKTLSAFVQDTEGLNLDLEERAWMLEQSAMWRSKPSSKQTWLRRLKKDSWMTHLSTRILKPSQQKSFEEKFTESLEDIPVSRSVARESEKERKTQDTCGPTSESMSGQLDLFGAFSRMSEVTPRWGYGESCPIWKKMVTERSGDCTQRRKQARLTNASDASSWPTPRAGNPGSRKPGTGGKILAEEAKKNWSTPLEDDSSNVNPNAKRRASLVKDVNIHAGPPAPEKSSTSGKNHGSWPTARSSDAEGGRIKTEQTEKGFRSKREKSDQYFGAKLRDAAEMNKPPAMKLNPNWVEQLMGLPIGWTDLGSWATESSPKPQK